MSTIYTIGFTKKSAEDFFTILKKNSVRVLMDIRLNNKSQLAGFSKYPDIEFFTNKIVKIKYIHDDFFSPTKEILKSYKHKEIAWEEYIKLFNSLMKERKIDEYIKEKYDTFDGFCLLCSEEKPDKCHRRLVAEKISKFYNMDIIHL